MEMELFDPPEPDRTGGRGARAGSAGSTSGPSAPRGAEKDVPLADRMRPRTIDEVLGQDRLLGPGKVLRRAIERDEVRSVIRHHGHHAARSINPGGLERLDIGGVQSDASDRGVFLP